MLSTLAKISAVVAIAVVIAPAIAFARGDDANKENRDRAGIWVANEFGVRVLDSEVSSETKVRGDVNAQRSEKSKYERRDIKSNNGLHLGHHKRHMDGEIVGKLFFKGTVSDITATGFTLTLKDGETYTVDADSATFMKAGDDSFTLADLTTDAAVMVVGTKNEGTIDATFVSVVSDDMQIARTSGTITEVNDDSFVVQTTDDTTITVNTTDDTVFVNEDGETVNESDVEVGMTAKIAGLWDSVLNVFNAIKVKLL